MADFKLIKLILSVINLAIIIAGKYFMMKLDTGLKLKIVPDS
jgi:hypothetical protein